MKKDIWIAATAALMLVVSRFAVRIVDTTVQIDDDIGMLVLLVVVLNAVIVSGSCMLYRKLKR